MELEIDILLLVAFWSEIFVLMRFDRLILGSWITPIAVLGVPYGIVVNLAWILAKPLNFFPLYLPSIITWMLGLFIFWLGGAGVTVIMSHPAHFKTWANIPFANENMAHRIALGLLWIIIPVVSIHLVTVVGSLGGPDSLITDSFAELYGSGPAAHLMVLSYPLLILLFGIVEPHQWMSLFSIAFILGLILFYQAKSWLIIPVGAGITYRWMSGRLRFDWRLVGGTLTGLVMIFFATYLLGFAIRDPATLTNSSTYLSLARHFANYLFAGVLGYTQAVQDGLVYEFSWAEIFAPIVNMYNVWAGIDPVSPINPYFHQLGILGQTSNVHTLFGTLLLKLGPVGALLYSALMGLISYGLYLLAERSRNCWFGVLWCFTAMTLAVGWFDFYFWHLAVIEASMFCIVLAVLDRLVPRFRMLGSRADRQRRRHDRHAGMKPKHPALPSVKFMGRGNETNL